MDYHSEKESWEWHGDDYYLQKDSNIDMPVCVWNGVTQNEEDISYIFEETTPVKACGELPCHFNDCDSDIMTKTPQDCKEFLSQVKRRKMLDFKDGDISSAILKSKERIEAIDKVLPEVPDWEACFQEDVTHVGFEDLCQSEAWLAECLNDTDINVSSDDGNASATSDVQVGSTEVCDVAPSPTPSKVTVRSSRNVIFKGRKSYMRAPTKLASAVAYPFDIIKPSGVRGDVTLKDINQKIRTPPPSDSKQGKEEETSVCYPTSAFSGKPVVGKTKIPTQGGKGSITIMRTKG